MKLPKSTGYTPIPEGYTIFQITNVEYDEDFDKMTVEEVTANGQKNTERFMFTKNDGSPNEVAGRIFGYLARVALNDFDIDEVEPDELIGCYFGATVEHEVKPNINDPSRTVTFVRLKNRKAESGFSNRGEARKTRLEDLLK